MNLTIATYVWGSKYPPHYVARLAAGLKRHIKQPFRFICISEEPEQVPHGIERIAIQNQSLIKVKGCFVRLEMFDPGWQKHHGIDGRLVSIDLDVVVTGPFDPLFDRPDNFVILQGANAKNPCPFNGSIFMVRAGAHSDVWQDFTLEAAQKIPFFEFPDDQAWLHHKIPNAAGWKVGPPSGVYGFQKKMWPKDSTDLPKDARLVAFFGWRDPEKFLHLEWVKRHWSI